VSEALTLLMHYCRIVNESVRLKLAQQPDGMLVDASFSGIACLKLSVGGTAR
jgi:hypothetical protein